jgi:hypothetical protein
VWQPVVRGHARRLTNVYIFLGLGFDVGDNGSGGSAAPLDAATQSYQMWAWSFSTLPETAASAATTTGSDWHRIYSNCAAAFG